jgi:hypothetical protein
MQIDQELMEVLEGDLLSMNNLYMFFVLLNLIHIFFMYFWCENILAK